MHVPRRQFFRRAAVLVALSAVSPISGAQGYPNRPVRLIVGYPPGGAATFAARLIGHPLSERLGQQFVVENRPGASSNIGTDATVKAEPDGYTLLLVTAANAINATLYDTLPFDFVRDIAPVAGVFRGTLVMVINPLLPVKTVPEFIAYAKANPGKINMASAGNGTTPHVAGELFRMMTGVNMTHVPYKGGAAALSDLLGGQVQVMFATMASSIALIKSARLRALAVTATTRSEALADTPTVGEFVKGYEVTDWYGLGAPKGTPTTVIDRLNKEINAALADPKLKAGLTDTGGTALVVSPPEFGKLIAEEIEKWGKVVKFSGARTD